MSLFVSEKQVTRHSAQSLIFESSVDQTIIKSVDAAVIAAAPGPDSSCTWPGLAISFIGFIFGFSQTFRDISTRPDN